jgi:hypothetical protein
MKHLNIRFRKKAELMIIKEGGIYSYHWALKVQSYISISFNVRLQEEF